MIGLELLSEPWNDAVRFQDSMDSLIFLMDSWDALLLSAGQTWYEASTSELRIKPNKSTRMERYQAA